MEKISSGVLQLNSAGAWNPSSNGGMKRDMDKGPISPYEKMGLHLGPGHEAETVAVIM